MICPSVLLSLHPDSFCPSLNSENHLKFGQKAAGGTGGADNGGTCRNLQLTALDLLSLQSSTVCLSEVKLKCLIETSSILFWEVYSSHSHVCTSILVRSVIDIICFLTMTLKHWTNQKGPHFINISSLACQVFQSCVHVFLTFVFSKISSIPNISVLYRNVLIFQKCP